jgi:hypothetical protein
LVFVDWIDGARREGRGMARACVCLCGGGRDRSGGATATVCGPRIIRRLPTLRRPDQIHMASSAPRRKMPKIMSQNPNHDRTNR